MDHDYICRQLRRHKLQFATERKLQDAVGDVLRLCEVSLIGRNFTLCDGCKLDYFLPSIGVGLECRVDGEPEVIFGELKLFAEHDKVKSLILVTPRIGHRYEFETVGGKPFSVVWASGES